LWSLSPSSEDVFSAQREFAQLLFPTSEFASGISPIGQNSCAVVLVVRIGPEVVLLGSDLEQTPEPLTGWNAVVGIGWPLTPASALKVPHHGSAGAFSEMLWEAFIRSDAIAVVTPYSRSGLPRLDELDKLKALGRDLFLTALPRTVPVSRGPDIDKELRMRNFRSFETTGTNGVVRLRKKVGSSGPWSVELFGSARKY
jgi:beta-lactamase superfamily II metal-dependent hydrolase